jgi:beta-galactosidase
MDRTVVPLKHGWRFTLGDPPDAPDPRFDDGEWRAVSVPHDWAIDQPFHRDNDVQFTRIIEDGEPRRSEHNGRTAGLPHVGVAWYRLRIDVDAPPEHTQAWLCFDGVMSNATVYLNGRKVGERAFGYASFSVDVRDVLRRDATNVLAVRVNNLPRSSRWYPGAGIYRNVRLVLTHATHVAPWGVTVTTPEITDQSARVNVRTEVSNQPMLDVALRATVLDRKGTPVAKDEVDLSRHDLPNVGKNPEPLVEQALTIADPERWSLEDRALYTVRSELVTPDGDVLDTVETRFGIREARCGRDGFTLNGERVRLQGVCMHHDLGALGAAVSRAAQARQIRILQQMGCNAIRTSHNPPDPALLDLCDEMGMLVLDEAFDEWRVPKMENGYHACFDRWSETDLREFIRRDRNHPCVFLWSIGNEIGEQRIGQGRLTARRLVSICHEEDPTRPVTAGFNQPQWAMPNRLVDELDVFGVNYQPSLYETFRERYPELPLFGSETCSCVSSRGFYDFPGGPMEGSHIPRESLQVASFDLEGPPWACSPDVEFDAGERCPFVMGEFVWTGFDYLGEPTPYNEQWPARSSYFGIIDLCGIPKDRFYLYQSHWTDRDVLHLMPHWTWPGREGQRTPVQCYTSFDRVELFLNGESQGVRQKDPARAMTRYRLRWEDVVYRPGELRAVALDDDGSARAETTVRTAGEPRALRLAPERTELAADGEDLVYVRVQAIDKDGTLCPQTDDRVRFHVDGPAELVATDNGDPTDLDPFRSESRRLFHGQAMAILRSRAGAEGTVTLRAKTDVVPDETSCRVRSF